MRRKQSMKSLTIGLFVFVLVFALLVSGGCGKTNGKDAEVSAVTPTTEATTPTTEVMAPTAEVKITGGTEMNNEKEFGKLTFGGRASVRLDLNDGRVIYIDPYAGGKEFYKEPADLVLVTHQHDDHNQVRLVTLKTGAEIIQCPKDITAGNSKTSRDIKITAVSAYNKNHIKTSSCGFVLEIDGYKLYHSGDTSYIEEMKQLEAMKINYALLCMDGYYNMGAEEAMKVAGIIKAKHIVPIHNSPSANYSQENSDAFTLNNKVAVKPGETISLLKD